MEQSTSGYIPGQKNHNVRVITNENGNLHAAAVVSVKPADEPSVD
jgi:hypothetical protein